MKKFLIVCSFVFVTIICNAQTLYFKAIGSFQVSLNSDNFYLWADQVITSGDSLLYFFSHEAVPYSLGGGKSVGGSLGFTLKNNFGIDLAVIYSKSSTQKFHIKSDWKLGYGYNIQVNYKIELDAKSIIISPTLHFKQPIGNNYFYSRFGLLFAAISMKRNDNYALYNNIPGYYPSEITKKTEEFARSNSTGITAGLGFEYYLFSSFYLFADVSYNYLKCVPESSKYTKYDYQGEDQLESMTISEKEFDYVNKYSDTDNQNPDKPSKELKASYPFDNIAIQFGLKYNLKNFSKKE